MRCPRDKNHQTRQINKSTIQCRECRATYKWQSCRGTHTPNVRGQQLREDEQDDE